MEEQRANNAGTGETGPTDSGTGKTCPARRGRFIVPTADLSARHEQNAAPEETRPDRRGRFIVPTADLSARGQIAAPGETNPNDSKGRLRDLTNYSGNSAEAGLKHAPLRSAEAMGAINRPLQTIVPQSLESISEEEFWKHAREQAAIKSTIPSTEEVRPQQYLECRLSCGGFLLPLQTLCEVMPSPHHYTLLPNIPGWMLGITQYSGAVIAVVDLDAYLCDISGHTGSTPSTGTLLVANNADLTVGLFIHPHMLIDKQVYDEQNMPSLPVIDMSMLLADVVQQIGIAAYHG